MLSSPLKQTNEIDWIAPLKGYIRQTYGDDPERYAEECATLNRLRQDMRGAGKDSAAGRDLLYRYYGQLELLDLRFPVDENHIKISFTWYVREHNRLSMMQMLNRWFTGLMPLPTNLPLNTPSHTKKPLSSSTSPLFSLVMPHTKIATRTPGSKPLITPSRPRLACSPISTRTFSMHPPQI